MCNHFLYTFVLHLKNNENNYIQINGSYIIIRTFS